jgi:hypothetical protein
MKLRKWNLHHVFNFCFLYRLVLFFFLNKFFLNYWLFISKSINFKNQLPRLAQELVYETYIKRLCYLSLIYSETIIWVFFFICLQQLIEVGAFASISTVFFKTRGVRGRSQTLFFCRSPFGQKGGDSFSRGVWIWNGEIAKRVIVII